MADLDLMLLMPYLNKSILTLKVGAVVWVWFVSAELTLNNGLRNVGTARTCGLEITLMPPYLMAADAIARCKCCHSRWPPLHPAAH